MNDHTIGIDISKAHLDAYRLRDRRSERFRNDAAGFRELIQWIGSVVDCVVYEPTGPYHRDVEEALHQAGLPLTKVNPRPARDFAKAKGRLAKTDTLDAESLAVMGSVLELRPTQAPSKRQRELKELGVARDALIRDRVAARNRREHVRGSLLKRQNQARLRHMSVSLRRWAPG